MNESSIGGAASLVLLHGWGMNARVFDPLLAALPGVDARAAPLPGHGGALCAGPTLDAWADALALTLPGRTHVLGWSLGGQVAIRIATRHPRRIAGLILLASTPRFLRDADWSAGIAAADLELFGADLLREPAATLLRFLTLQTRGAADQRALLAQLRTRLAEAAEPDPRALADGLALLRSNDLRADWRALDLPTLVIHGGRDFLTPVAAGEWLHRQGRRARALFLPTAAHAPHLSHPGEVAAAIRSFLDVG